MNEKNDPVLDDDLEGGEEPPVWEELPRPAKLAVYEHLRAMIAQHRRDGAMALLMRDANAKDGQAPTSSPIEVFHEVAAMAFSVALETLEDSDPELCTDCGEYHNEGFVHIVATDPKDLS